MRYNTLKRGVSRLESLILNISKVKQNLKNRHLDAKASFENFVENHSLSKTSFVPSRQKFPDFNSNVCSVFRWLHFFHIVEKTVSMGQTLLSVLPFRHGGLQLASN